ncbi:MAG: hypothetical protein ACP5N1_04610, partial [Candidatus Woesearchaeota archaeon]
VYDQDANTVSGASVDVTCNDITESTVSNVDGDYYVSFASGVCYFGDEVSVNAVKDEASGSNEGFMCQEEECDIPITVIDVTIPEFGIIAGAFALVAGLGIIAYRRK